MAGGGVLEKRRSDVSRSKYRYVTLTLNSQLLLSRGCV